MFTKNIYFTASIVVLLIVSSSSSLARGAYKWVDEDGTVHYSDRLQGSNAEVINVRVPVADDEQVADERSPANTDGQENDTRKSKVDSQPQSSQREQKKRRKENCKIAQATLKKNQSMGRMYRIAADGEWIYFTGAERDEVLKKSRDAVKEWCR